METNHIQLNLTYLTFLLVQVPGKISNVSRTCTGTIIKTTTLPSGGCRWVPCTHASVSMLFVSLLCPEVAKEVCEWPFWALPSPWIWRELCLSIGSWGTLGFIWIIKDQTKTFLQRIYSTENTVLLQKQKKTNNRIHFLKTKGKKKKQKSCDF